MLGLKLNHVSKRGHWSSHYFTSEQRVLVQDFNYELVVMLRHCRDFLFCWTMETPCVDNTIVLVLIEHGMPCKCNAYHHTRSESFHMIGFPAWFGTPVTDGKAFVLSLKRDTFYLLQALQRYHMDDTSITTDQVVHIQCIQLFGRFYVID